MSDVQDYTENAMKNIIKDIAMKKNVTLDVEEQSKKQKLDSSVKGYMQAIYYGVPGCGKSFCIDSKLKELGITNKEEQTKRVVFHPEYTNSDFIGQILPKVEGEKVKYEFTPGPFTEILKEAYENKDTPYALIIEEINRGNAAAIFGELFQLLDRFDLDDEPETVSECIYSYGWSSYCVNNDNINEFIRKNYKEENAYIPKSIFDKYKLNIGIRLPPNLSLFATMNTSDQNVFKLDNAFKRRWDLELIPNEFDFTCDDIHSQKKQFNQCNAVIEGFDFTWGAFRSAINEKISNPDSEDDLVSFSDKQIGTWFVKANEQGFISSKIFSNKVLEYLWDDVLVDNPYEVFSSNIKSLAQIIGLIKQNETDGIFSVDFMSLIDKKQIEIDELQKNTYSKTKDEINPNVLHEKTKYLEEVEKLVQELDKSFSLNLSCKQYIGVKKDKENYGENFVFFMPKPNKKEFRFGFLLNITDSLQDEIKKDFDNATFEIASKGTIRCKIALPYDDLEVFKEKRSLILSLMNKAYKEYFNK